MSKETFNPLYIISTTEKFDERFKKILNHYGADLQQVQTIQELAELIQAITKHDINYSTKKSTTIEKQNILDEIADVYIMIEQLKIIFEIDDEIITKKIDEKLTRQMERIKYDNSNNNN